MSGVPQPSLKQDALCRWLVGPCDKPCAASPRSHGEADCRSAVNFDKHSKLTRRAEFLAEMHQVAPWREPCAIIAPCHPKAGNGHPPIGSDVIAQIAATSPLPPRSLP